MPEVTSYAPGTPSWVDLLTSDPEGARAFYGAMFGWEFVIGGPEYGNYVTCTLDDRIVAGIAGEPAPEGLPTAWTTYLATPDAAALAQRVTEHGGKLMMEPLEIPGQGTMLVAFDPQGAAFGAWQGGALIGAQVVNEPGALVWNELATRDLAGAQAFYSAVVGFGWQPVDSGQAGPPYAMFEVDGKVAGGAFELDEGRGDAPPHWMTYFEVADTDAAAASVERLGGQVISPPRDSAYGRVAVARDPQGGAFCVIEGSRSSIDGSIDGSSTDGSTTAPS